MVVFFGNIKVDFGIFLLLYCLPIVSSVFCITLLLGLFPYLNPFLFFFASSSGSFWTIRFQNMFENRIKSGGHIRLQILLFLHIYEFNKNLFNNFKESRLVCLLFVIGFKYLLRENSYKVINKGIIDLLLISYCKA